MRGSLDLDMVAMDGEIGLLITLGSELDQEVGRENADDVCDFVGCDG